jgi:hypothetical protein
VLARAVRLVAGLPGLTDDERAALVERLASGDATGPAGTSLP